MAQQQKAGGQPKDPYAQRTKTLYSTAQKIRGWVGSDPSRTAELADALVALTAHRLLGHAWTAAAADAQESVKLSAQLLTANGPIGPYTDIVDAVRYVSAVVQFGVVQVGLGLPDAAGRSIASLAELHEQLGAALAGRLSARTAIWALSCSARAALALGEVGSANAYADAAQDRLVEARLAEDPDCAYLVMDTDRLSADARWAAGDAAAALGYAVAARERFDAVVDGRLAVPARLGDALRDRLAAPLPGLYGDLADRLSGVGETDLALQLRRELSATLQRLAERSPETSGAALGTSLGALAAELSAAGRGDEAAVAAAEAEELGAAPNPEPVPLGEPVHWEALDRTDVHTAAYAASTPGSAGAREAALIQAARNWRDQSRPEAAASEAARAEQARSAAAERAAANAAERAAEAERSAREEAAAAAERARADEERAAAEEAERQESKRRRAERIEEHRRLEEEAERREVPAPEAGDPAELERLELERLQAELDELEAREQREVDAERRATEEVEDRRLAAEQVAAERAAAERAEAEEAERRRAESERRAADDAEEARLTAQAAEAERLAAARAEAEQVRAEAERQEAERQEAERQEAERQEAERQEAERQEAERQEAERQEAGRAEAEQPVTVDELAVAQRGWDEAKSRGDRRAARAANERVVELLRPRAETDLTGYGPILVSALEDLSRARLRGGDIFGSRACAKEAKAIAKSLGT